MSRPRTLGGDVSAMYAGAACIARPMPAPYARRAASSGARPGAAPAPAAPAAYSAAAAISSVRRPTRLPAASAARLPPNAPSSDVDTTRPDCSAVKLGPQSAAPAPARSALVRLASAPEAAPMS